MLSEASHSSPRFLEKMVRLTDEELAQSITIILAAHSEKFPQLKGKAVRPDLHDEARRHFAMTLVEHLRRNNVQFFGCGHDWDPLSPRASGSVSRR